MPSFYPFLWQGCGTSNGCGAGSGYLSGAESRLYRNVNDGWDALTYYGAVIRVQVV